MITVGTDFSGIGAPEQALKELEIEHDVLFACDKDKYARQTYLANHSAKVMYEDITTRDNSTAPAVDIYFFGFPCQAFSISGKRAGFEDVRGTLFFNSADYIRQKRPKVFVAENVKGLLSHDKPKGSKAKHGRTFSTIINVLAKTINGQRLMPMYKDNLGYHIYYTVLNSKHYDVPQNRERIFIVGFRDEVNFSFPSSKIVTKKLADILESNVDQKYFLNQRMVDSFMQTISDPNKEMKIDGSVTPYSQSSIVYNSEGVGPSIISGTHGYAMGYISDPVCARMVGRNPDNPSDRTPGGPTEQRLEINSQGLSNTITSVQKDNLIVIREPTKKGYKIAKEGDSIDFKNPKSETRRGRVGHEIANTLDVNPKQAVIEGNRIRRLTERECMRLQGFPDYFILPCSATQLYKQAGNSITVTVIKAIILNILKALNKKA